jgi:hypothetical protein
MSLITVERDTVQPREVLSEQVQAAVEDVAQVEHALGEFPGEAKLSDLTSFDFGKALGQYRRDLTAIQDDLSRGGDVTDGWDTFAAARARGGEVLAECLAFMEGGLLRGAGVATGLCALADRLLADISSRTTVEWGRFTILASAEFFAPPARIVRLRFPEASIWSLPIAAHELGHYIVPKIGEYHDDGSSEFPFSEMLREEEERGPARHLREFLADAFATYVVGPSFATAYLFLRFDPARRRTESWTHPSDNIRMHMLLSALAIADAESQQYAAVIELLRSTWEACVSAGPPGEALPTDAEMARYDELAARAYELLQTFEPVAAYNGWFRALTLAPTFGHEHSELPLDGLAPWDVINAAWLFRMKRRVTDSFALRRLSARATQACWDAFPAAPAETQPGGPVA